MILFIKQLIISHIFEIDSNKNNHKKKKSKKKIKKTNNQSVNLPKQTTSRIKHIQSKKSKIKTIQKKKKKMEKTLNVISKINKKNENKTFIYLLNIWILIISFERKLSNVILFIFEIKSK
ncbi:hypothetical protein DDB_G0282071 [Dictyostelium discoideum AX4]|uniref:Uncharacterized protein n=1 Tax=Dictyostelium discoideum TaxID=44689 RepID=Q54T72_DICDI|nr:hypothetical protein DDB_G0282071 [Dictyostelium discoideum AX4]EAL66457.1 hypothetical protein DDB_G0282071 [Dictyostelium discoideum AX4]|eukprot:XP_640379.1 hypothetical protein DDB_G0282071 [Dictyostelium discoideum AX4]